jgi:hypothetical protein
VCADTVVLGGSGGGTLMVMMVKISADRRDHDDRCSAGGVLGWWCPTGLCVKGIRRRET